MHTTARVAHATAVLTRRSAAVRALQRALALRGVSAVLFVVCLVGCGFPQPARTSDARGDGGGGSAGDASLDGRADGAPDAPPDVAAGAVSVTLSTPAFLQLGSAAPFTAALVGAAGSSLSYSVTVVPAGAATVAPSTGTAALGSDGTLVLSATLTAGSAAEATMTVHVTGSVVGAGSAVVDVSAFQTFGARAAFADSGDSTLNGGRLLAVPLSVPSGARIIAFGIRATSAQNVRLGLYAASGSAPGALLLSSAVFTTNVGETVAFFDAAQTLPAASTFIGVLAADDLGIVIDQAPADAVSAFARNAVIGGPLPSPFGTATTFSQGPLHAFVIALSP